MKKLLTLLALLVATYSSAQLAPSVTVTSSAFVTATGGTLVVDLRNTGAIWHKLTVIPQGTITTCSAQLDFSDDNVTYTAAGAIAAFNCVNLQTAFSIGPIVHQFVRINVSSTLAGANVVVRYDGFVEGPQENPCASQNVTTVGVSTAAASTLQQIAAVAGQRIYICSAAFTVAGADTLQLEAGTGANCGTPTNTFTGVMTLTTGVPVNFFGVPWVFRGNPSSAVCTVNSAAVQLSGYITFAQVPF